MSSNLYNDSIMGLVKGVPKGRRNFAAMANRVASYCPGVTTIASCDMHSLWLRMATLKTKEKVYGIFEDEVYKYTGTALERIYELDDVDVMMIARNVIIDVADDDCCWEIANMMCVRDLTPGTYIFRTDNNQHLRTLAYKYSGEKLPNGDSPWICTRLRDVMDRDEILVVCRDAEHPLRFSNDL